ncbi:MAG: hypothetical protein Q7R63_02570 [bacterium]|nr:hypothetical protein [bacterium]
MALFFRNKLNVVLWVAALVMVALLVAYLLAAGRFLVSVSSAAFGDSLIKTGEIVTFNLAKAAQLKEMRGVR